MVAERFFQPRRTVVIIASGDGVEAMTLRLIVESLSGFVLFYPVGTPDDFLQAVSHPDQDSVLTIISGHGGEFGFHLGEYSSEIDVSKLRCGDIEPDIIRKHSNLEGKVILSTACGTGNKDMQAAFLAAGAAAYIAPSAEPEGADIPLFVHTFAHRLITKNLNVSRSFEIASRSAEDVHMTLVLDSQKQ